MITIPEHPTNTAAETDALRATCERLQGFDGTLSLEFVDGMLCALAAAPRQLAPDAWLPLLFDDNFERVFADPEDHARALQSLQVRLRILCAQLDPEELFSDPEALRLDPIVMDWSDEAKAALIAEQHLDAAQAKELEAELTGGDWAEGFLHAVEQLGALWQLPADDAEANAAFDAAFDQISVLTLLPSHARYAEHIAKYYPAGSGGDSADDAPPTRDDLLAEACLSVQDLRMHWVDFAPKTQTIRVEPKPGRNDPCPCGSGKKYKKCHGAVA